MSKPGDNVIEAKAGALSDRLVVQYTHVPSKLACGAVHDARCERRQQGAGVGRDGLWIGDQPYTPGGFSFVGGTPTMFDKDLAITNTARLPLYFTFQSGMSAYRFDVPDG